MMISIYKIKINDIKEIKIQIKLDESNLETFNNVCKLCGVRIKPKEDMIQYEEALQAIKERKDLFLRSLQRIIKERKEVMFYLDYEDLRKMIINQMLIENHQQVNEQKINFYRNKPEQV